MLNSIKLVTLVSLLCLPALAFAQTDSIKKEISYTPKVEGIIKVKFEESLYDGQNRFDVRNSRFGVRGNVAENMSYRMQVEFNNEGKLAVLDAYVAYDWKMLSLSLGQQNYAFSTDLARNPAQNMFANRTFVAKYVTTYADTTSSRMIVRSLGSRDIGGLLTINFKQWVPIAIKAGLFNGNGANNPVWHDKLNVSLKALYGNETGLQAAASCYFGTTPFNQNISMWGGELRYIGKKFTIDSEVAQRSYEQDGTHTFTAAYVQGFYKFDLKPNPYAHYLAPTLRWDIGDNSIYDAGNVKFDAQRISVGLNLGIAQKLFQGEIRANFEKYILSNKPSDYATSQLLHDKFTIEFVVHF